MPARKVIETTAFDIAQRFVGTKEVAGAASNPLILAMLNLDQVVGQSDEISWCSAFVNWIAWMLRLPRSKSLRARSWLTVGLPIALEAAQPGFDVVILKRGDGNQPGPDVIEAPGHVGFYAGVADGKVLLLAGNQGNTVSVTGFDRNSVLGVRRLL